MDECKSKLEERVTHGIYGAPELKKEERSRYLGQFRERVLIALTVAQVEEPGVYAEVMDALRDPRARMLILRRDVQLDRASDYIELALEQQIAFKRVDEPGFKGSIGLVVVANDAVDVPEVQIPDRRLRLLELGFSEKLIDSVGKKLCAKCWEKLATLYPQELVNYRRITWVDILLGEHCVACE